MKEFGPVPSGDAVAVGTPSFAAAHKVVNPPAGREVAAAAWMEPPRSGNLEIRIGSERTTEYVEIKRPLIVLPYLYFQIV